MSKDEAISGLPEVGFFDARAGGVMAYAAARRDAALALRNACFAPAPPALAVPVLQAVDRLSIRWLRRSASPYAEDVEALGHTLGFAGVAAINMGYQFGCTTGAAAAPDGLPFMRRVLDWPLPGLGRGVEVVHQSGPAGDFLNVSWPGAAGVLTATAPGRFCAAINQAPLLRRTRGGLFRIADQARHLRQTMKRITGWPPDHLLRYAFETCTTFDSAVALLQREPVARPVLFVIAGTTPGETALIERTETEARLHPGPAAVANDWQQPMENWEGRGCGKDKRMDNRERRALMQTANDEHAVEFAWVRAPILNARTRLAVEMDASGQLRVRGYERARGQAIASQATQTGVFGLACA